MRPILAPLSVLLALALGGCAGSPDTACPACAAGATVTPVAKTTRTATGEPIRFPAGDAEVSACTYDIRPGAKLPVHKHPYPRFAYVMAGDLRVALTDGRTFDYHPGDFIAETVDTWHYGEARGAAPVKLLVIDATPPGAKNTILRD